MECNHLERKSVDQTIRDLPGLQPQPVLRPVLKIVNTKLYREGERAERGELNLLEAAATLGTCHMTVLRLIRKGTLEARQACKGAPWVIKASALAALDRSMIGRRRALTSNPDQKSLEF